MRRLWTAATGIGIWTAISFFASGAAAFDGHRVAAGGLTLEIEDPGAVTRRGAPVEIVARVRSESPLPIEVRVRAGGLVDDWKLEGPAGRVVEVSAGKPARAVFRVVPGPGSWSALYPVHVWASRSEKGGAPELHAVRILQSRFRRPPGAKKPAARELPAVRLAPGGALDLVSTRAFRLAWRFFDGSVVREPVGSTGTFPASRVSLSRGSVARGEARPALSLHPPWFPRAGTAWVEFRVALPRELPLQLSFATAIRDHTADEPPSDGVTFRVLGGAAGGDLLFERHSAAKRWQEAKVDLSRYAGRTIFLRLESHPGPKHDTTCDGSFWGRPVITSGRRWRVRERREERERRERALEALGARPPTATAGIVTFELEGGLRAAVAPGPAGIIDAAIALGRPERAVVCEGLAVEILGQEVGRWSSGVAVEGLEPEREADGGVRIRHRCRSAEGETYSLDVALRAEGPALRVHVTCERRISDLAPGPFDRRAERVWYGHGYCIVDPQPFRAHAGGHDLSTSHVGMDFEGGASLLVASDHPPGELEVDPARRVYALHTAADATLTFLPGDRGAFDSAVRYRSIDARRAAPAVARKAGRMVLDIWGGRYRDATEAVRTLARYGVTDCLLTLHVWQRWGYDYRLPDIWPPDPALGTVADLRDLSDLCRSLDIPWGLHDNYIDFYPDAEGYSYDHIAFDGAGRPIAAWYNQGREAQSYRWRPDHILPFVKRNLELAAPAVHPTHWFIDVFTSIPCFDYHDREGRFHSRLETRAAWAATFDWIRERLGGDAPMTSEAGDDHLVGHLDGADCQHLELSATPGRFRLAVACRDWERVPWFDAVLHDKFSLHGVGYSSRYQAGRPRAEHGIESDDYLSAEILEGHAPMVDRGCLVRGAVRKYWLTHGFLRAVARDRIAALELEEGDIHRQTVRWESGAVVRVNRGEKDWRVEGRVLPRYGFLARAGDVECSIEKLAGVIVERSRDARSFWVDARGFPLDATLAIRPLAGRFEALGPRRFRLPVLWEVERPAPADLAVFVHFVRRGAGGESIDFQSDHRPSLPTSRWEGTVTTGGARVVAIPEGLGPGEYEVLVGLFEPRGGRRFPLRADDADHRRYRIGTVVAEGKGGAITALRFVPAAGGSRAASRWNLARREVDFGAVKTAGGVRGERIGSRRLRLTPLPGSHSFGLEVSSRRALGVSAEGIESVAAVDAEGRTTREVAFERSREAVRFRTERGEFAYVLKAAGPREEAAGAREETR